MDCTDSVIRLGRVALAFGRVNRITFHPDGTTPESDTDHTVMLSLIACAFATAHLPDLDLGKVAQLALVHDLVEVYAGDTPTLHALSEDAKRAKRDREDDAFWRIVAEVGADFPWLPDLILEYENRTSREARYVKALDKLMPKITHVLNDLTTIRAQGMSREELAARYDLQEQEIREYADDFPELFDLRKDLVSMVMMNAGTVQPTA